MKKVLATHFVFTLAFFILFSVYRNWLNISFVPLWWGAVLGMILPFTDYLIYVYVLKPKDTVSQKVVEAVSQKGITKASDMLMAKLADRKGLLMHNASFQFVFLIFAIWMVTSGSLLGMGLVLAFMLHLVLDQIMDLVELKNIDDWFVGFPLNLDYNQKRWFVTANAVVFIFLGFFF